MHVRQELLIYIGNGAIFATFILAGVLCFTIEHSIRTLVEIAIIEKISHDGEIAESYRQKKNKELYEKMMAERSDAKAKLLELNH